MTINKIFTLVIFILLLGSFFLITFRVDIFIPSIEYKIFAYSYTFISVSFLVYNIFLNNPNLSEEKRKKNVIVVPLAFVVLGFLSLSGIFYGISGVLQHIPSQKKSITKIVTFTYQNIGRGSNVHGFEVEGSYFYGRMNTTKEVSKSLRVGDIIIFHGKENFSGFYSNKYEIKRNLRQEDTPHKLNFDF